MASSTSPLREVGGYELLAKLGQGGMGAVYKARQKSLDRIVALKILPPSIAKNAQFIERFQREARTSAKLNHPNIVQGIDVGFDPVTKLWFFAMELIDGPTLTSLLKTKHVLTETESLLIVQQISSALEYANKLGIVHRDIKPDNILLTSRNEAKLADLGLAKQTGDDSSLTQSGQALGTPNYMSPEQAKGLTDEIDIRSDIYSLGATLFHLVTGRPPFSGSTNAVVMVKHIQETAPKASTLNATLSPSCCRLITKMLEKDVTKRQQTPAELSAEIEAILKPRVAQSGVRQSPEAHAAKPVGHRTTGPRRPVTERERVSEPVLKAQSDSTQKTSTPFSRKILAGCIVALGLVMGGVFFLFNGAETDDHSTAALPNISNLETVLDLPITPPPSIAKLPPVKITPLPTPPVPKSALSKELLHFDFRKSEDQDKFKKTFTFLEQQRTDAKFEKGRLFFQQTDPKNFSEYYGRVPNILLGNIWELKAKVDIGVTPKESNPKVGNQSTFCLLFSSTVAINNGYRFPRFQLQLNGAYSGFLCIGLLDVNQSENLSGGDRKYFSTLKPHAIVFNPVFTTNKGITTIKPPATSDGLYDVHLTMHGNHFKGVVNGITIVDANLPAATAEMIASSPLTLGFTSTSPGKGVALHEFTFTQGEIAMDTQPLPPNPSLKQYKAVWTKVEAKGTCPSPRGNFQQQWLYDSKRKRCVLFGGSGGSILDDMWAFYPADKHWECLQPINTQPDQSCPPGMFGSVFLYLENEDQYLLTYGRDHWMFNPTQRIWKKGVSVGPAASLRYGCVYDKDKQRLLYFNGDTTWFDTLSTHKEEILSSAPMPQRNYVDGGLVYSQHAKGFLSFGGYQYGSKTSLNDTWFLAEGKPWKLLKPNASPPARMHQTLLWFEKMGAVVLVGGANGTQTFKDVWYYDVEVNTWIQIPTQDSPLTPDCATTYDSTQGCAVTLTPKGEVWTLKIEVK